LRLRSFPTRDGVVAFWQPEPHHNAFEGRLCGGIIGTLLDCHTGATLAWELSQRGGLEENPFAQTPWATSTYTISLRRPAPTAEPVRLVGRVQRIEGDEAVIDAGLEADGKTCATCTATWRRVKRPYKPTLGQ
jgi:acyl-coenzyme A thioesterase PaaI-like protein